MAYKIPSHPRPPIIFLVSVITTYQLSLYLLASRAVYNSLYTPNATLFLHVNTCVIFSAWKALTPLYLSNSGLSFLTLFKCHFLYEIFFDVLRLRSPLFCISKVNSASLFTSVFKLDFNGLYLYLPFLLNH